jgi:hypothetical protein
MGTEIGWKMEKENLQKDKYSSAAVSVFLNTVNKRD